MVGRLSGGWFVAGRVWLSTASTRENEWCAPRPPSSGEAFVAVVMRPSRDLSRMCAECGVRAILDTCTCMWMRAERVGVTFSRVYPFILTLSISVSQSGSRVSSRLAACKKPYMMNLILSPLLQVSDKKTAVRGMHRYSQVYGRVRTRSTWSTCGYSSERAQESTDQRKKEFQEHARERLGGRVAMQR